MELSRPLRDGPRWSMISSTFLGLHWDAWSSEQGVTAFNGRLELRQGNRGSFERAIGIVGNGSLPQARWFRHAYATVNNIIL